MTYSSLNTTAKTTDAGQKALFDPSARQIDSCGLAYADFQAALNGEPDKNDDCNTRIQALIRNGRSEAFCREYRAGYEGAARGIRAVAGAKGKDLDSSTRILCSTAGLNRACEAYPEDIKDTPVRTGFTPRDVELAIARFRVACPRPAPDFGVIDPRIVST